MRNPILDPPPFNRRVKCTIVSELSGAVETDELVRVAEDDVTWRVASDNSELNERAWTVIGWVYAPYEGTK
tara:strand:- start:90 stop:302 length:213 start_codon:yes stop_codon:yes gene_type:complete